MSPVVRVVGLGPGDAALMTVRSRQLLRDAAVARLRTRVHPGATEFDWPSYDDFYDSASDFASLYQRIADDLAELALAHGEVVYAVPGSPVVAEHTVELLRARRDLLVICEPAVSVIDVACATLGIDPMAQQLTIVDALASTSSLRGDGPWLVLQTYAPEILASLSDRVGLDTPVTILHHLGLADQVVLEMSAAQATHFEADHLTSVYVGALRTAGAATDDLVEVMKQLRRDCPWDQEQTHQSLTRHFVEECYEALDALEALVQMHQVGDDPAVIGDAREELGDVLFQIIFHAELAEESGYFSFAGIADAVREKLIFRHPHVFSDVEVANAAEVETRWAALKKIEKGRASVTDGIATHLPALSLYLKLRRTATAVGVAQDLDAARGALVLAAQRVSGGQLGEDEATELLSAFADLASAAHLDLEALVRRRAGELRSEIRRAEGLAS